MFKKLREKAENFLVNKLVDRVKESIRRYEQENFWSDLHRQLRRERWSNAERLVALAQNEQKFNKFLEQMITLSTSRGYEGKPIAINVSLTGLFFRFVSGNKDAITAIGQAVAAMTQVEFERAMGAL